MSSNITLPQNLATLAPSAITSAAEHQISSAEILQDAHGIRLNIPRKQAQVIQDLEELRLFQLTKRKDYEQQLNKNRLNYGQWIRYAKWEIDHNHDFRRARSIMERALDVNIRHVPFWVRYIELELLHKNVNHARNLLDRAVTVIPRTQKLWFIYVQTEETLGNYTAVRLIFERWMKWNPGKNAWVAYIQFEERYEEYERVRALFLRFVREFRDGEAWKRWLVFETERKIQADFEVARVRGVFEAALDNMLLDGIVDSSPEVPLILRLWARWEVSVNEPERAWAICATAIDRGFLLDSQRLAILEFSSDFTHTTLDIAELPLTSKRSLVLQSAVSRDPEDYDSWWDLVKLKETANLSLAFQLLATATRTSPSDMTKLTKWRRYVYLWIKYALMTEYKARDVGQARQVWNQALDSVLKRNFIFAKLWIMYAEFELRNGALLMSARKVLGRGIGHCKDQPKAKLFKFYIGLEERLGDWSRVRKLYEKWLEVCSIAETKGIQAGTVDVLMLYIEFEKSLDESDRCIALYELAIGGDLTSSDELFDDYIDFLRSEFRYEEARDVFVANRKDSVIMWVKSALFESSIMSPEQMDLFENLNEDEIQFEVGLYHVGRTREVFQAAYDHFKASNNGPSAITVVEAWAAYEDTHGDSGEASKVRAKAPKLITKQRNVAHDVELYEEYEFPASGPDISKFLANARKWAASS